MKDVARLEADLQTALETLKAAHNSLRTFSDSVPDEEKQWTSFDEDTLNAIDAAIAKIEAHNEA